MRFSERSSSAKADRSPPLQVAHHDPVRVALLHRDLVDADDPGGGFSGFPDLLLHVPLVQLLDRVPIEHVVPGHVLYRLAPTLAADVVSEPLGAERAVEQPLETLALHPTALPAVNSPDLQPQVNAVAAARQIPNKP
jgi:hypothetical protein